MKGEEEKGEEEEKGKGEREEKGKEERGERKKGETDSNPGKVNKPSDLEKSLVARGWERWGAENDSVSQFGAFSSFPASAAFILFHHHGGILASCARSWCCLGEHWKCSIPKVLPRSLSLSSKAPCVAVFTPKE